MKKLVVLILVQVLLANCSKTVSSDEVVFNPRISKVVLKNTDNKLFTGEVKCYDENGLPLHTLKLRKGENITDSLMADLSFLCKSHGEEYESLWDIVGDSTIVFMADCQLPFSGIFEYNSSQDAEESYFFSHYRIKFRGGKKNGEVRSYFESGKLKHLSTMIDNRNNGNMKNYYESGALRSEENYETGIRSGTSKEFHENGQLKYSIDYIKGKEKDGEVSHFNSSGALITLVPYASGQINGTVKSFYNSGKLRSEIQWVNGEKEGSWKYFNETEEVLGEGTFSQGTGTLEKYNDNMTLAFSGHYLDGKLDGLVSEFDENGNPKTKIEYKSGNYHGIYITYYSNGKIKEKTRYDNGKKNGKHLQYYESGRIEEDINYQNDNYDGWYLKYEPDGSLKYDFFYKNGSVDYGKKYRIINPKIKRFIQYVDVKLEKYGRDYSRDSKPYDSHVRAYFQFKNISKLKIIAIKFDFVFKDAFGDELYSGEGSLDLALPPGVSNAMNQYYYWEDSYASPYKKLWSPVESGNVETDVVITKVVLSDGTVIE